MCHFRGRAVSNGPDFTSGLDVEECAISGLCMGRTVTSRRRNLPISNFTEILPDAHLRWVLKHDGLQGCSAFLHTLSGATSRFAPALRTMALGRVPGGYRFNYVSSGRCLLRSVIVPTMYIRLSSKSLDYTVHRTLSAILPASGVCGRRGEVVPRNMRDYFHGPQCFWSEPTDDDSIAKQNLRAQKSPVNLQTLNPKP